MTPPPDDVYNPTSIPVDSETPPLSVVLRRYIDAALAECRVWMPATVTLVIPGPSVSRVTVQPTLMRKLPPIPAPIPLPPLQDLPVWSPRGNTWGIKLPVAIGDPGVVLFCDRSLDLWKQQAVPAPVDPGSTRTHDLSDGIFIPGLFPLLAPPHPATAAAGPLDMVLYSGLARLQLQPQGGYILGNGLFDNSNLLFQLTTALEVFAAAVGASSAPAAHQAAGAALAAALSPILLGFTALQGVPGA